MAVNITGVANSGVAPRSLQATSTGRLWVAAGGRDREHHRVLVFR